MAPHHPENEHTILVMGALGSESKWQEPGITQLDQHIPQSRKVTIEACCSASEVAGDLCLTPIASGELGEASCVEKSEILTNRSPGPRSLAGLLDQ